MWRGMMSKFFRGSAAPRAEIDERPRTARLRLEQIAEILLPRIRPTRPLLRQHPTNVRGTRERPVRAPFEAHRFGG